MKSNKLKKIILVLLVVVLALIWYDNLKQFLTRADSFRPVQDPKRSSTSTPGLSDQSQELDFVAPRFNPFEPPSQKAKQPTAKATKRQQPDLVPKAPSQTYRLVGYLNSGKAKTATLADNNGIQFLANVSDTVSGWKLRSVHDKMAVFMYNKQRDTLRLSGFEIQ